MTWRHFLGVFAGVVFGFVFTLVLGLAIGIVMAIYYTSHGGNAHELARLDLAHVSTSLPVLLSSLSAAAFALLLAGLLAGWIARTWPTLTGLAVGIVSSVLSLPLCFIQTYPLWYDAAAVVGTIAPAAMGGYLARVLASLRRVPLPAAS